MRKHILWLGGLIGLVCWLASSSCSYKKQTDESPVVPEDTIPHVYEYGICIDSMNLNRFEIRPGDNPALIFARLGFSPLEADSMSRASAAVLDPTKLRAGMHYCTLTTQDSLQTIRYIAFAKSLTDYAIIDLTGDTLQAFAYTKDIHLKRKYIEGTIRSSLWNEIAASGVSPLLALEISDVYAWQIDFFDVKEGDAYQVIFNEAFVDDTTSLGVESVDAAIFIHQGKTFTAIPFTQDSVFEYFDLEGNSLRKAFLKAPLDFFRITSRFSNARFHPILKRYRAHHGVDYAAPTGTPVKSIGAGTVVSKGWAGGGGNTVKIKHNGSYTTSYMHLSRYAKGLAVGQHVQQGEVIGYVGSTGLSTGPHLDFRVYRNGQAINPLEMDAPPSLPVKPELRDSFMLIQKRYVAELDSLHQQYRDTVLIL
ncbi:metalloendopeptidase [Parabacteroides sp. An277]|uniref:M23 family metallopeptidase n=1 Tax=Parabacteroides sp. An277 TaxID=1965619 RepID=UPI000B37C21A|nr:M23 family metallopeptidase [Parabacteroides sp. An277]OUO51265.1 metalloendopeptidase [Parabacteroides sp. An277]